MRRIVAVLCAPLMVGCASPYAGSSAAPPPEMSASAPPRTLIMASNTEVQSLAPKMIGPTNPARTTRLFNAALALVDNQGEPRPYLAEALPQLNTDSWRVFPDGRMETTWRLRPGLTWHAGTALAADDFVLAWRVHAAPTLGVVA